MEMIGNISQLFGENLKQSLKPKSCLELAASCFSIYAYAARVMMFLLSLLERRTAGCLYTNPTAQTLAGRPMRYTDTNTETLNLRVSPTFKQFFKEAADHEQRSMVNMLEVLLGAYWYRKGIVPPSQKATPPARKRARAGSKMQVGAAV